MYYSQQNEDKEIYEMYFKNKEVKDGFFVELGGFDGITYSNSKFFEDTLGFSGILIEASPVLFDQLKVNRPKSKTYNFAISEKEGSIDFVGHKATSGMLHTMGETHRKMWELDNLDPYKVPTNRMDTILKENDIEYVDFFSLDVEGGELDVMKTIDWSIPIGLFLVEMTTCYGLPDDCDCWTHIENLENHHKNPLVIDRKEKDMECRRILSENGFEYVKKIGCNDLWINKKNFRYEV